LLLLRISGIARLADVRVFLQNSVLIVVRKSLKYQQVGIVRLAGEKVLALSSARIVELRNRKLLQSGFALNADVRILLLNSALNAVTKGRDDYEN
jgi:hypothetical protein